MNQVYIFFAQGFEEIEGLTVVDLMRRAGISVTTVSIGDSLEVRGAHHIQVTADCRLSDADFSNADMLVLPGGSPGTCNLESCKLLTDLLINFYEKGKYLGAICAAPMILGHLGFLKGRKATCYPGFEKDLYEAEPVTDPVIIDGPIITSRGLGTAIEFACTLIGLLTNTETAERIKTEVIYSEQK